MAQKNRGGRPAKADAATNCVMVRFTDEEYARFLALVEASGAKNKAHFITSCIFGRQLRVVKIDKAAMDYYMRLTTFHAQFRAVGANYNQVTKAIKTAFSEKKALAFLYRLEKATLELVSTHRQVLELTDEFERKHLSQNL